MKTEIFHAGVFSKGFTLIETLVVIVTLGIAAVTIASLTGNIFMGQGENRDIVVGTQMMQECAENILAVRRNSGYNAAIDGASFNTNKCGAMTSLGSYAIPKVTFSSPDANSGCPTGAACKVVSISQGGLMPITMMLVNY